MGQLVYYCAGADINNLPAQHVSALLFNTLDHGANDKKIENAKQMRRIAKPNHVILDSSGFQILEAQRKGKILTFDSNRPMKHTAKYLNLSPEHVMRAAAIHQVPIAIGLDFPIRKLKGDVQQQLEFFKKKPRNVQWAYESFAWKNALIPGALYFQPIQCYNLEHLDIFLNDIAGVLFDGVSMPIRNLRPAALALFLVSFYQRGIRRIHLLGTSNFENIAICAYAARNMFEWVSLDSTSWRLAADNAEFISPLDLSRIILRSRNQVPAGLINECPCPHCQGRNFTAIQAIMPFKDRVQLIRQHNWWILNRAFTDFYHNSPDIVPMEEFLLTRTDKIGMVDDLVKILSVVKNFKGIDIAMLQMLLTTPQKKRKQSRSSRRPTSPASRPRKPTRTPRKPTALTVD
jgi:hypothetical protein